jgi:hypothetical protein
MPPQRSRRDVFNALLADTHPNARARDFHRLDHLQLIQSQSAAYAARWSASEWYRYDIARVGNLWDARVRQLDMVANHEPGQMRAAQTFARSVAARAGAWFNFVVYVNRRRIGWCTLWPVGEPDTSARGQAMLASYNVGGFAAVAAHPFGAYERG